VSSKVQIENGRLHLTELRGEIFGGEHVGEWQGNLQLSPPQFSGTGKFERISLAQLADAMKDDWISGTGKASYQISASGKTFQDWFKSANGVLQFELRDGSLAHIAMPGNTSPLRVRHFLGRMALSQGTFEFENATLDTFNGKYDLTGSATPERELRVKFSRAGGAYLIDGTLSAPHIVAVSSSDTRASLKP
jgi:uncharacterized protein involved in outer membrane biogenesis